MWHIELYRRQRLYSTILSRLESRRSNEWHCKIAKYTNSLATVGHRMWVQRVQNALLEQYFKTITIQLPPSYQNSTDFQSISELMSKSLHWRTSHLLMVNPLTRYVSQTFSYLSSLLIPHQPQRSLRSVNQNLLSVPRCNSSFGQRSFPHCAPRSWNDIPPSVRQSPSLDSFKRNLRTR